MKERLPPRAKRASYLVGKLENLTTRKITSAVSRVTSHRDLQRCIGGRPLKRYIKKYHEDALCFNRNASR